MNLAKISANGQVTVPAEIRRKLALKGGDKIIFSERADGEVVISNAANHRFDAAAIVKAQRAFEGAAGDFGIKSEDDVQRIVDEVRYGKNSQ